MRIFELLKQNAPAVFEKWARNKIFKLERELKRLRQEYVEEKEEKRREEIRQVGEEIKKEIEEIKGLLKEEPSDRLF